MFKKATIALIAVMSCFALIGVGFSSWAMGAGNTVERSSTGKLSSESVIVSDEYIKVEIDNTNFVVTPYGFNPGMNVCNVTFTLQDAFPQNMVDTAKLKVTLTLNGLTEEQGRTLFGNIQFSVQKAGEDITVGLSEVTFTETSFSAEYDIVDNIRSLVGSGNTIQGTFTFNHKDDNYTALYNALQVDKSTQIINNPFSLVVAVSNDQ